MRQWISHWQPAIRTAMWAMLMALVTSVSTGLAAETPPQGTRRHYEIAAMPIGAALSRFSEISGVDLLLREPMKRQGTTHSVRGVHTPGEALDLLLKGTGLVARFTSARSAVVIPVDSAETSANRPLIDKRPDRPLLNLDMMQVTAPRMIGGHSDHDANIAFAQKLGAEIRRIVLDQAIFPSGRSIDLRLTTGVTPDGALQDVRIVKGSNNLALNTRILGVLEGARPGIAPPTGLRQPLTFDVAGR